MSETRYKKVLFLDIDGVLNSRQTFERHRGAIGIDRNMAALVAKIVANTECDVVLSSSWRKSPDGIQEVEDVVVKLAGVTPNCCAGIRGVEIYKWVLDNVPYDQRDELRYAILDDDSDLLIWQQPNFFQTSFDTGLTLDIAEAVIAHLNRPSPSPNE